MLKNVLIIAVVVIVIYIVYKFLYKPKPPRPVENKCIIQLLLLFISLDLSKNFSIFMHLGSQHHPICVQNKQIKILPIS